MDNRSDIPARDVYFGPIDLNNWRECVALEVGPDQQTLICTNDRSLAEAGLIVGARCLAIRVKDEMIGLMVVIPHADGVEIHRFMIAWAHQKKGYGTSALRRMIEMQKLERGRGKLIIKFEHWNVNAEKIYRSVGFIDTGLREDTEKIFSLDLQQP